MSNLRKLTEDEVIVHRAGTVELNLGKERLPSDRYIAVLTHYLDVLDV